MFLFARPFHTGIALWYWCCRASPVLYWWKHFLFRGIQFVMYPINYFVVLAITFFCPLCWPRLEVSHIPLYTLLGWHRVLGNGNLWLFACSCLSLQFGGGQQFALLIIFSCCEDGHNDSKLQAFQKDFVPFSW